MRLINCFFVILWLLLMPTNRVQAQASTDTLLLEQAIAEALSANYRINVAKYNAQAAQNRATTGNAGMMPKVDFVATDNASISNRTSTLADGRIIEGQGAKSNTLAGSLEVSYSLFNGFANRYTYEQLIGNMRLSDVQTKLEMENTIVQVINTYLQTHRLQQTLSINRQTLDISKERYARLDAKSQYGQSSSIDLLNALVDLNTDSMNFLDIRTQLETSKRELNFLTGRSSDQVAYHTVLSTSDTLPALGEIIYKAKAQNSNLLVAYESVKNAEYERKIATARQMPTLMATGSFAGSRTDQEASFQIKGINYGPGLGIALNFNIFDGGKKQIAIQNAKIAVESNLLLQKEVEMMVEKDVRNTWAAYEKNKIVAATQRENIKIAQANFERTNELFKMGLVTTTQFREAQLNLLRVENALINALTEMQANEFELMRLSGDLLTEN